MRALLILALLIVTPVKAHDIYTTLRQGLVPEGQLCCGGDPETGDCEAISEYRVFEDGAAVFVSRRYGKTVLIGKDKITWQAVPGGTYSEAHWCGKPRTIVSGAPITPENPDPELWTYCAFIAPGGV